ncbi:MAG TPA: phosphoribosyltransferase family protein [Trueperaceae bacterium]|nr:phosphoribosyltransferase family protein [Trueperaceae bacterium]
MTLFRDRRDAGRQLAAELQQRTAAAERGSDRSEPPLVLALPRGGVPVAAEVAAALRAPLDVVVVRKLGAPGHEELALGAIAAIDGLTTVLNDDLIALLGIDDEAIERVKATEIVELRRRERAYRGERPPLEVAGREVIVVDDGVATGATMLAAAKALRQAGAAAVTLAVPVAPLETVPLLAQHADEVVCLHALRDLNSVGQWYADFSQTTDEEVTALLARGAG